MKYVKTFEKFELNEGHATFKPGSLIEFHIPNTGKTHTGRIITIEDEYITVLDLKTDEELRLPKEEFGPTYEN